MTVPATPANHTPQPTQNGLIMLSTSGGTTPRTRREATPGATPHRTLSDVDAERYAAVPLDEIARAVKDIADGRPVIVVDDANRENEGDLVERYGCVALGIDVAKDAVGQRPGCSCAGGTGGRPPGS